VWLSTGAPTAPRRDEEPGVLNVAGASREWEQVVGSWEGPCWGLMGLCYLIGAPFFVHSFVTQK
jgi:hypothetical protein